VSFGKRVTYHNQGTGSMGFGGTPALNPHSQVIPIMYPVGCGVIVELICHKLSKNVPFTQAKTTDYAC
jgi:hypothetical protein